MGGWNPSTCRCGFGMYIYICIPRPPIPKNTPTHSNYLGEANAHIATLAMIETAEAMQNLDEIVKVDGLDGVFIGVCWRKGARHGLCVCVYNVCPVCRWPAASIIPTHTFVTPTTNHINKHRPQRLTPTPLHTPPTPFHHHFTHRPQRLGPLAGHGPHLRPHGPRDSGGHRTVRALLLPCPWWFLYVCVRCCACTCRPGRLLSLSLSLSLTHTHTHPKTKTHTQARPLNPQPTITITASGARRTGRGRWPASSAGTGTPPSA